MPRCPISPSAARNTLMKCVTCGMIFLMARAICKDRDHARTLLVLLVASATVAVGYGLIMQATTLRMAATSAPSRSRANMIEDRFA